MEAGNRLILHSLISRYRNEGIIQALIRQWLIEGYHVRPVMQHLLKKFRFVPTLERFLNQYEDQVEIWYRPDRGELQYEITQEQVGARP